jgi:plasmid stabilization system protein ParE
VKRRLVIRPDALQEIDEAAAWYKPRRRFLARAFINEVNRGIRAIAEAPERFPIREGEARHLVLSGFPYSIIYKVTDDEVIIIACFHDRRDPAEWKRRL